MTSPAGVAERLIASAPAWVRVLDASEAGRFACETRRTLRDGTESVYRLRVDANASAGGVAVVEEPTARLPAWCADRHLYGEAGFCLGLPQEYPAWPITADEASRWWNTLYGFLLLQDDVAKTRRWPASCAWPHGPDQVSAVVLMQRMAEMARLPLAVVDEWRGVKLQQQRDGSIRVEGRRGLCPCGSRKQVRHCHEAALAAIVGVNAARDAMQARFWASQGGRACCGTLEACPLRRGERAHEGDDDVED